MKPSSFEFNERIGRIEIIGCETHAEWLKRSREALGIMFYCELEIEAEREGFESWHGLMKWFTEHKVDIMDTHRLEFKVMEAKP